MRVMSVQLVRQILSREWSLTGCFDSVSSYRSTAFQRVSVSDGEVACQVANCVNLVIILQVFPDGREPMLINALV